MDRHHPQKQYLSWQQYTNVQYSLKRIFRNTTPLDRTSPTVSFYQAALLIYCTAFTWHIHHLWITHFFSLYNTRVKPVLRHSVCPTPNYLPKSTTTPPLASFTLWLPGSVVAMAALAVWRRADQTKWLPLDSYRPYGAGEAASYLPNYLKHRHSPKPCNIYPIS